MKVQKICLCLAGLCLLAGLVVWMLAPAVAAVMVTLSSTVFAIVQRQCASPSNDVVVKRLFRQQLLGGIFLVITGLLMCNQVWQWTIYFHRNEWMVALAIACVLQCYSAFRLPYAMKK